MSLNTIFGISAALPAITANSTGRRAAPTALTEQAVTRDLDKPTPPLTSTESRGNEIDVELTFPDSPDSTTGDGLETSVEPNADVPQDTGSRETLGSRFDRKV